MTLIIAVAVVGVTVIAVAGSMRLRGAERRRAKEQRRFEAAAAVTSRWARDPSSSPRPVLDIAAQRPAPADDTQADAETR